jgi:hypothetical protein
MKRLLLLFPLYILFLSGLPCSPNDGCCAEEIHAITSTNDHNSTNNPKSNLPCSPFFPCGACHGVVVPNHTILVIQSPTPEANLLSLYTEKHLLAYSRSIWQPPKSV